MRAAGWFARCIAIVGLLACADQRQVRDADPFAPPGVALLQVCTGSNCTETQAANLGRRLSGQEPEAVPEGTARLLMAPFAFCELSDGSLAVIDVRLKLLLEPATRLTADAEVSLADEGVFVDLRWHTVPNASFLDHVARGGETWAHWRACAECRAIVGIRRAPGENPTVFIVGDVPNDHVRGDAPRACLSSPAVSIEAEQPISVESWSA